MNRRNIRIKVMQVLYMLESNIQGTYTSLLIKEFDKTRNLFSLANSNSFPGDSDLTVIDLMLLTIYG